MMLLRRGGRQDKSPKSAPDAARQKKAGGSPLPQRKPGEAAPAGTRPDDDEIRRAFERFGLSPDASYETVLTAYQAIVRRLQDVGDRRELQSYAKSFYIVRKHLETQTAPEETPEAPGALDEESALDSTVTRDPLRHYLKVLGLPPEAAFHQVETAFEAICKGFPYPTTREERERQARIRRAYSIVARIFEDRRRIIKIERKRRVVSVGAVVLALLFVVLVATNLGMFRRFTIRYGPGDLLYRKNDTVPFGTIVAFDPAHKFAEGRAVPAYQVQLRESTRKVWISKHTVVGGMRSVRRRGSGAPSPPMPTRPKPERRP